MEKIKRIRVIHQNNIVSAAQDRSLLREQGRKKRKKQKKKKKKEKLSPPQRESKLVGEKAYGFTANSKK